MNKGYDIRLYLKKCINRGIKSVEQLVSETSKLTELKGEKLYINNDKEHRTRNTEMY